MRKIAALVIALPLLASAQDAAQPPGPPAQAQPSAAPQSAPPSPPQYAPPPPPRQYAPQGQYAPPPPQYAPAQQGYPPPGGYRDPYARRAHQRDSWYIGFGVGGGDARIKLAEGTFSADDFLGGDATPVSLSFKVGATLTPKLLLGFDLTSVSATAKYGTSFGDVTRSMSIVNLDAVATYFPMERGLFLRGGVGLAGISAKEESPAGDASDSVSGVDLLGGVGYAFWLGRAFNLTVGLDYSVQRYGGSDGPDSSSFWTLGVGCDWY